MAITKMEKAKARMLIHHPFFATILLSFPLVETRDVPTLATDMRRIYYNPDFCDQWDVDQIMFGLAHEVMHIALMHGLRQMNREMPLWNFACDYAINWMLQQQGFKLIPNILLDKELGANSAEVNYELLKKKQKKIKINPGATGGGTGSPKDGGMDGGAMGNDVLPMPKMSPTEESILRSEVATKVAQAANMARMAGKLPGDLDRLIDNALNPIVPWTELMRDYMLQLSNDEERWSRRNRRIEDHYLPGRHSERMGDMIFIGDTSGSITPPELSQVCAEVTDFVEKLRPSSLRMIWADTRVAAEQVFELGDELEFCAKGFGGTDMRVPLEYVEQYDPQVVVLITDGYTPWPAVETPYPLIVCCTTDAPVPVGFCVRLRAA